MRPTYKPSETHEALHPQAGVRKCSCVLFTERAPSVEDDPLLCLRCNRQAWSRLFVPATPEPKVIQISRSRTA